MITEKSLKFNVQLFALPSTAIIGANGNNVQIDGNDDTTTYAFTSDDATSSDTAAAITSETITADSTANVTLASGSWIKGGNLSEYVYLNDIGILSSFNDSSKIIQLSAENDTLSLTGIAGSGGISIYTDGNSFNQTINGIGFDATFEGATLLNLYNSNSAILIFYSSSDGDNVTLNNIDVYQMWDIRENQSITYKGLTFAVDGETYVNRAVNSDMLSFFYTDEDTTYSITAENAEVDSVEIADVIFSGMNALNGGTIQFKNSSENTPYEIITVGNAGTFSVDNWNFSASAGDVISYSQSNVYAQVSGNNMQIENDSVSALTILKADDTTAATVNGVDITFENASALNVMLEEKADNAGISSLVDIEDGTAVTISGDNSFTFNSSYTVENTSGDFNATVESSALNVAAESGDNLNISGGAVEFEVSAGQVTLNGEEIILQADSSAGISMNDSDITAMGLAVGDSISTSSDKVFEVTYDSSAVADDTDYILTVNDTNISLKGSAFEGETATLNFTSDGTVIISGVSTDSTITATSGTYQIEGEEAVTITGDTGYITGAPSEDTTSGGDDTTSSGDDTTSGGDDTTSGGDDTTSGGDDTTSGGDDTTSGGDDTTSGGSSSSTKFSNIKKAVNKAEEIIAKAQTETTEVAAFNAYSNLSDLPSAVKNSTVAGYEKASTETPIAESVEGGINISVDNEKQKTEATLGDTENLRHVKLTSAVSSDVIIAEPEGDSIYSSIIDVSDSTRNTLIAVGTGEETSYVNHTIIGSSHDGTTAIILGDKLKGKNYVQAGDNGTYIYNAGANATLKGGSGQDIIFAGGGDYVEGGADADIFIDSNGASNSGGYTIGDYSISDGDIIVATKLENSNSVTSSDFEFKNGAVAIAGGNFITLGNGENQAVFTDATGSKERKLMWANTYGGEIDASNVFASDTGVIIVADQNGNRGDTITGSVKSDTIFAAGNDVIYGGDGKDKIYLSAAEGNEFGTIVDLTEKTTNTKEVNDWSFGFDKSDNMILGNAENVTYHVTKNENVQISTDSGSLILIADDNASRDRFDFLIGDSKYNPAKVSVVKNRANSTVESNADLADIYVAAGKNSSLTFGENITKSIEFSAVEGASDNINYIAFYNNSNATMKGTSANEEVSLGGAANKHATKTVSLGGGNDTIYSGGSDTSITGNVIQFSAGDGNDSIYNFGYYQGKKADVQQKGADVVEITGWNYSSDGTGTSSIKVTENKISVSVDSSSVLNVIGEVDADNMARVKINGTEYIVKVGLSDNKQGNEFTFNKEVDVYYGDVTHNNDKLIVDSSTSSAEIYLDGSDGLGLRYYGISEVDASAAKGRVILYGNSLDNVLTSGGANATLWGGDSASNDELIGSDARDTFLFGANGGNDTVSNFETGMDKVKLLDTSLEDIVGAFDGDNAISITLSDGSKLTVESEGSLDGATFQFSEGTYKAQKQDDGSINWK